MKRAVKSFANVVATLLVLPAVLLHGLAALVLCREKNFAGWSQAFSLLPGMTGVYLRRAFYRWVLPRCGKDAWIGFGTVISHPTTRIGERVYVGAFCCLGDISLEDDVLVASHVSIANGGRQHGIERLDIPIREQPGEWPHIAIGQGAWIGDRAVVLADVGPQAVIGAGSVVTKSIPEFAIAVGNPARIARFRGDQNLDEDRHLEPDRARIGMTEREPTAKAGATTIR